MGNKQVTDPTGQLLPGKGKSQAYVPKSDMEYKVTFMWTGTKEVPQFLEYKKDGLMGAINKWQKVPLDPNTRKVSLSLAQGSYQSRWAIDEGKWMSPDVRVPGLVAKLLQNEKIKIVAKGLNLTDMNVCDLPDGNIKTALLKIEDFMPANKWSLKPKIEYEIGLYVDGALVLTGSEKLKKMAQDKMREPKFRRAAREVAKKAAIKAIKLAMQQIGIPFHDVIDDVMKVFDFEALSIDLPSIDFDVPEVDLPDVDFGELPEGGDEEKVEGRKSWESRYPKASSKIPVKFEWLAPGDDVGIDVFSISHQDKPNHLKLTKLLPKPAPVAGDKPAEVVDPNAKIPEGFYGGWGADVKLNAGKFGIRHVVDSKKFIKYDKNAQHHDNAFRVIKVSLVQPNVP